MKKISLILLLFLSACIWSFQGKKVLSHSYAFAHPIWSADGRELIGTTINASIHKFQVYGFNTVTQKKHLWFETSNDIYAEAISPDGKNILISSLIGNEFNSGLWIINVEKTSTRYFLDEGTSGTFSPDGKKVMIYSCTMDQATNQKVASIYSIDLLNGERNRYFEKRVDCLLSAYLSWSPNGEYLAFSYQYGSINNSQNDLYVLRLSDHQVNQLDINSWSPSWAPDGNTLVYAKGNGANISLEFIDLASKCIVELTTDIGEVSWSHSSDYIGIAYNGDLILLKVNQLFENGILKSKFCK